MDGAGAATPTSSRGEFALPPRPAPAPSRDDADVIEIIKQYSPPAPPPQQLRRSPRRKKGEQAKKKQNSLEAEFQEKDVYADTFIEELRKKYDLSRKETDRKIRLQKVRGIRGMLT